MSYAEIDPSVVNTKLQSSEDFILLDVREDHELETARIDAAIHIPLGELPGRTMELDEDADIVVFCHHGGRSAMAASILVGDGFTRVSNMTGGIHQWAEQVDTSMPTY